jgi:hypothetical protein
MRLEVCSASRPADELEERMPRAAASVKSLADCRPST